jgi:integrase/recombinase XerD
MTKARLPQDGRHVRCRSDEFRPELRTVAHKHLTLKGLQPKTIEAYSRAIRRVGDYFDHQIDDLSEADLLDYFTDLRETHSWSSVKLDLYGLKFHYEHVLKKPWVAPGLVKPPRTQRLPDIITVAETERIFLATQVLSYRVFFFALYSPQTT